jgi:prephenate dehydrogenase
MKLSDSTVCIIGMGLIGGSMGMALKSAGACKKVIGVIRRKEGLEEAVQSGACDEASVDLYNAVAQSNLIIVATPVNNIVPMVTDILTYIPPGTIITDVGSTKNEICRKLWSICPDEVTFIGGHPMAGSEKTGIQAADRYLFQNAVYVLTPQPEVGQDKLELMLEMVEVLGAQSMIMQSEEHDLCVAAISHLPHLVAAGLVSTASQVDSMVPKTLQLAASGFRDTTRIASGSPIIWKDICLSNKEALIKTINLFQSSLESFKQAVKDGDEPSLLLLFDEARQIRQQIPAKSKGLLMPLHEVVVELVDKPGELARVTGLLADEHINIKDIEILRIREGEGGTLLLGFEDELTKQKAHTLLDSAGYKTKSR